MFNWALVRPSAAKSVAAKKDTTAKMIGAPVTAGGTAITGTSTQAGGPNGTVVSEAPTVFVVPPKEEPTIESESFVDEIPAKPETLNIESAGKPLAFGSLMETPAAEIKHDGVFVAPPSPELADRDWNDV